MSEVLERLRAEVTRLKLALERATMELVSAKVSEAKATPGTPDLAFCEYTRAKFALECWTLECQLATAVAMLKAKEAEVEYEQAHQRLQGRNPTAAWATWCRKRFEARLEEGKRTVREMVEQATDEQEAKRRLEEEARLRREADQRPTQRQRQSL